MAMTTDVLPELASGSADVLRLAVERGGPEWTHVDLEGLVAHSRHVIRQMKAFRDSTAALLHRGTEAESLRAACQRLILSLDAYLESLAAVTAFLEAQTPCADQRDWLAALREDRREGEDVRRTLAEWLEVLNRPLPADFWNKATAAAETAKGGPFVRVEKYEDLFSEPSPRAG
jgi:hypothetical protein